MQRNIYTISDTHLSFDKNYKSTKPMSIFGQNWENYEQKIKQNWQQKISSDDIVVIGGDISWAMNLDNALYDLKFLNELPGQKILLKGNHDYWWSTKKKINDFLENNRLYTIKVLQNDSYIIGNVGIVGTRLWQIGEDAKITSRENIRLQMSIDDAIEKFKKANIKDFELICFTHYMPMSQSLEENDTIKILQKNDIKKVYYGHLHGDGIVTKFDGNVFGIDFKLVSADGIGFDPLFVKSVNI